MHQELQSTPEHYRYLNNNQKKPQTISNVTKKTHQWAELAQRLFLYDLHLYNDFTIRRIFPKPHLNSYSQWLTDSFH